MWDIVERYQEGREVIADFLFDDLGIYPPLLFASLGVWGLIRDRRFYRMWWEAKKARRDRRPNRPLRQWEKMEKERQGLVRAVLFGNVFLIVIAVLFVFVG